MLRILSLGPATLATLMAAHRASAAAAPGSSYPLASGSVTAATSAPSANCNRPWLRAATGECAAEYTNVVSTAGATVKQRLMP